MFPNGDSPVDFLCENPKKSPRVKGTISSFVVGSLINLHKLHCQWDCDTPKIDLSYSKQETLQNLFAQRPEEMSWLKRLAEALEQDVVKRHQQGP